VLLSLSVGEGEPLVLRGLAGSVVVATEVEWMDRCYDVT
jgi:hypothetical protein